MKLWELVTPNESMRLRHPIIGYVKWDDLKDGQGWALYFAHGYDKDDPLVVDELVLFDDQWEKHDPPWSGKLDLTPDQCLCCGTRDDEYTTSSHAHLCLKCYIRGKKPNKHLVRRDEQLQTVRIREWCEKNGLDFEWEYGIFS